MKFWKAILVIFTTRIFPWIRRVRGSTRILSFLVRLGIEKQYPYPRKTIMDRKWDYLIVLDACRYDVFKEVAGDCDWIISTGSGTVEWIKNTFKDDWYDLVYISANPWVSNFMLRKILGKVPFFHLEPVWDYGWDSHLKTVPPREVVKAVFKLVKKYPKKRMIIHFAQPHYPFIGKRLILPGESEFPRKTRHPVKSRKYRTLWDIFRRGKFQKDEVWAAYKDNLKLVLKEVKKLSQRLKGKVVITSDHGEMFGEWGIYEHPVGLRIEELVKVPWVEKNITRTCRKLQLGQKKLSSQSKSSR